MPPLSRRDITESLGKVGVAPGSHLLVHSSLRSLGEVDGGADAVIDALLDAVGPNGTLAMPAFHYTRPLPQPCYDPRNTPGKTGFLTERFRQRPRTLRSLNPTHSLAAQGPRAAEFLDGHLAVPTFGVNSPIDRLAHAGGWVLLMGVTHLANSTIHVGESHAGVVKFLWEDGPAPVAQVRLPDGSLVPHVIDPSSSCSMAFNAIEFPLRRAGRITDFRIGPALCFLMKGRDIIDTAIDMIRLFPDALMCTRAACRPCRMARAHLAGHAGQLD